MTTAATALHVLIAESVRMWRVPARVSIDDAGTITVAGLGSTMTVARAAPDLPFRWTVAVTTAEAPARPRPALSVVSVVRQVRIALDPAFSVQRLRVVAPAVLPPTSHSDTGAS